MDKKRLYKLELLSVKYVPILIAFCNLLNIILYYFDVTEIILDIIAGNSLLTTVPMYISSYVYKFCKYHRMFIHYIVATNLIDLYDRIFTIPVGDFSLLMIYMIITGVFAFLALYYHQKYGGRNND